MGLEDCDKGLEVDEYHGTGCRFMVAKEMWWRYKGDVVEMEDTALD